MELSQRGALWIVATGVIVAGLYFLRGPLTQFAMALILWLAIDGLATTIDRRIPFIPRWLALPAALVFVLSLVALIGWVVVLNVSAMTEQSALYEVRLNEVLAQSYEALGVGGTPPTIASLAARIDPARIAAQLGEGLQNLASDVIFILIYLGFLFPAAAVTSEKLDRIFTDPERREAARDVGRRIRESMERYLWVQTVVSLIITALTYATLVFIGVEHALFWSFVVFFLNKVPTIGSIAAVVLVTAVALAQFTDLTRVAAV
ncbi:MAG: AI-2E family transporter, partial [Vitreimonas sp.]